MKAKLLAYWNKDGTLADDAGRIIGYVLCSWSVRDIMGNEYHVQAIDLECQEWYGRGKGPGNEITLRKRKAGKNEEVITNLGIRFKQSSPSR